MWFNAKDVMSVASNFIVLDTVGYEHSSLRSSTYKGAHSPTHATLAPAVFTY
jgi:hypothetical protein